MSSTVRLDDILGGYHPVLKPEEAQYAALTYISMGWAVTAGPGLDAGGFCSCHRGVKCGRNAGKHAHGGWGNDRRMTLTYEQAREYWSPSNTLWKTRPVDQVFIVPYLSGLVVADVDDEVAWLKLPESERPETLTQRSGSGRGPHLLYKYEWDMTKKTPPALHSELKGGAGEIKFRGIIGVAPDPHRSGGRYTWENWGAEVAPAPAWMTEERAMVDWSGGVDPELLTGFWANAMFDADRASMERVGSARTKRPLVVFACASTMAKWVGVERITEEEVVTALMQAAAENGAIRDYGAEDIERQIRNGLKAGGKKA